MAHAGDKRPAHSAFADDVSSCGGNSSDNDEPIPAVLSRTLGLRYRLLGLPERLSLQPSGRIFPWGLPREIWELIAAYLTKADMDCLALVSRDVRSQVWHTRLSRKLVVPLGCVREALARSLHESSRELVPSRHSLETNACVADVAVLSDFLNLYTHIHRLTVRSPVNHSFQLPPLPSLHSLSLVLSDIPLPFAQPLPVRGLCLELTRWRDPDRDILRIAMHTQLRTLKMFVNKIGATQSPGVLDLTPLGALSHLNELHFVSYQLSRPLLRLPTRLSLSALELHCVAVAPSELHAFSSLTSLRLSVLSMPADADDVIATLLKQNTALQSLSLSWFGDLSDSLPCHCLRSAPPTLARLALAPLVDFRALTHLTRLRYLDLRACHSAFSVARLPELTSLRTLVLDDHPPFRDRHFTVLGTLRRVLIPDAEDNGLAERIRGAVPQVQVVENPTEEELEL